jgi:lipopolysaccharide biosynthesis glycosyltransferase
MIKKLVQKYDEVLYLDFDVITNTHLSFFEHFDLNTICVYNIDTTIPDEVRGYRMKDDNWHPMDMYVKACCKNAMLLLDDIDHSDLVINTGVIGVNKKSAHLMDFSKCFGVYHKAKEDNLYPIEISNKWKPNNEVYLTYMIERYNLPYTNIGLQWNFILDDSHREISSAAYFYHVVNKDFGLILE